MAQEESAADESAASEDSGPRPLQERCIPLRRVRGVTIIDDHTIIWDVAGGAIDHYRMTLSSRCPGLVGRGAFVHSSSGSRLCDVGEWIRVAGGTRAICAIDKIEPWTPPEDDTADETPDEDSDGQ